MAYRMRSMLASRRGFNMTLNLSNSLRPFSSKSLTDEFYKVTDLANGGDPIAALGATIKGEVIDHAVDLKNVRPGEVIEVPYEVTVSHSFRDFWQSAFYSHDRINTSTPFARALGLQDQVVPFGMMLFLAASMSHADHAKLQVGFSNAKYHWPAFAGDTFKKSFEIQSLRTTKDKKHSLFTIRCKLVNQRGVTVFSADKTMMFPFEVPPSAVSLTADDASDGQKKDHENTFLQHLIERADVLKERGSQTLTSLRPGQLLIHSLTRPLSETHAMQLATLARLTHEKHFNTRLYNREELMVPGGLVFGLTTSLASRDLHETLYEDLSACSFPNTLAPGDTVSAMSFVASLDEHVSGDIEAVTVRTIGLKNIDLLRQYPQWALPTELFTTPQSKLRPQRIEELLKQSAPELLKKVVCVADRRLYRQAPKHVPFLL